MTTALDDGEHRRTYEARQADVEARCEHGELWWQDCPDCWLEAEVAFERGQDR